MLTYSKFGKMVKRNRVLFPLALAVLLILGFSLSLSPAAGDVSGGIAFEETVDAQFAKPGDKVNFTLSYTNNFGEALYNVTAYDWLPPQLTFVNSYPFYDGASEPETGFYRWSRGRIVAGGSGTIRISALVNEVPVGMEINNTAHLACELGNGTQLNVASIATVTVTQVAGVDVFPDQIHSVAPHTGAQTEYNITLKNTGNALDTFDVIMESVAYSPSGSTHDWKIELFNPTGYYTDSPVNTLYDDNLNDRASWTDHGVITNATLGTSESTWFVLRVTEGEGTSGSGDAFLDVHLIARSVFDPNVSDMNDADTIVRSIAGITFAPDYSKEANPGETLTFSHIIVNSGQSDVIDLSCSSSMGWSYAFFHANGTALLDTDGSGQVDVGVLPRDQYTFVLVKVTVPYSTPAGSVDSALITAKGLTTGNLDTINDTTTVKSAPMLGISKTLISESLEYQGDVVTYEIHIVNLGNTMLIKIPLDDTFDTTCLNFSGAQPAEDSYDELAGNIHWNSLGALEPSQSVNVTISFVATAGQLAVRESANVIDAEDEFANLVSATCINRDLNLVGSYTLTVISSPAETVGAIFNVNWIDHGSAKDSTFATPEIISCDEGTTVAIDSPESPINDGDTRYVFADCLPSSMVSMDSDKTVTLNYRTEYRLTFSQTGSTEPVYLTVDGIQLSEALPRYFLIEKDSAVTFSYPSTVTDSAGTTRYVLTGVSGNETNTSVTVSTPTVVTGIYKTQYYLSLTIDPDTLDNPQNSGWYDDGTYAQLHVEALTGGDGINTRFRFDHWSGIGIDDAFEASTQILMDAPKTATAHFVEQFRFVVFSEHSTAEPAVGEHWYDIGTLVTTSVVSPADESSGTRYICTGWLGAGSVADRGSSLSVGFTITAPSSIEWIWTRQHYLTIITDPADFDNPIGEGWYDEGTYAQISVETTTGGDGVNTRYRFDNWVGTEVAQTTEASTTIKVESPKSVQAVFVRQFFLTMSTNFGNVSPQSAWYDVGSAVTIEAFAPTVVQGKGYVWHGWTGTGDGSYSGTGSQVVIVINGVIAETAYWKIDPIINMVISNETIANGDRIIIRGETSPAQSGLAITVIYNSPNGSAFEHTVYTDDQGKFEDELVLDKNDLYSLLVENGEWNVTVIRLDDDVHEATQGSTTLTVESESIIPFPPILLLGAILAAGVIAFVPPARNKKKGNGWRRLAVVFSVVGLILGAVCLMLSWVVFAGTVTANDTVHRINVQLYPLTQGVVSISDGIKYVGPQVSSMVQMNSGPILSLYLIPAACAATLIGLYKPKSMRQRDLKTIILVIAGVLIAASLVQTYIFTQNQEDAIKGASIGYGTGIYIAIISCGSTLIASLFATRENNNCFIETPRNTLSKVPAAFSKMRAFIARTLEDARNLVARSFKTMPKIPTDGENPRSKVQKAKRAYIRERIKQQGLLKNELTNLNTLLKGGSIDEETWTRLKKVLKKGYETKREELRGKYGFTNRTGKTN